MLIFKNNVQNECLNQFDLSTETLFAEGGAQRLQVTVFARFDGAFTFGVYNPGALLGLINIVLAIFYQSIDDMFESVVIVVV